MAVYGAIGKLSRTWEKDVVAESARSMPTGHPSALMPGRQPRKKTHDLLTPALSHAFDSC